MSNRPRRRILALAWVAFGALPAVYFALGSHDLLRGGFVRADCGAREMWILSVAFFGVALLCSLFKSFRRAAGSETVKRLCFALMPALVFFAIVELASGIYLRQRFLSDDKFGAGRLASPLYAGFDWAGEIVETGARVQYEYAPFRLWKASPMQSPLVNIDAEGNRKTWRAPRRPEAPVFRVQVYGGSTVFCLETPDAFTLPSCLAKALAHSLPDRNVVVENRGVPSYVREQEAIWFEMNLRDGPKPDLAIFYDGANDLVTCGWEEKRHDDPERFERAMAGDEVSLASLAGRFFYRFTNLGRLVDILIHLPEPAGKSLSETEIRKRARTAAERFTRASRSIRAQARAEGVATAFFLQPTLYAKKRPTDREKVFLDYESQFRPGIAHLGEVFGANVTDFERARRSHDSFDLSYLFAMREQEVFFDIFHVGPRENQRIADAMVRLLARMLPPAPSAPDEAARD